MSAEAGARREEQWEEMARLARGLDFAPLWRALAPQLERWLRSPGFLGRVSEDEDLRREILVRAWEQLQDREFAKLRAFAARGPAEPGDGRRFRAFLHRVVKNLGIDYLRSLPDYQRKRAPAAAPAGAQSETGASASAGGRWRSIVSLSSSVEAIASDADGQALARRMLEFLDASIAQSRRRALELADAGLGAQAIAAQLGFDSAEEVARVVARARERLLYRPAIELWSQGFDAGEIAARLGLDGGAAAADRLLGAAKELLRRHFRE